MNLNNSKLIDSYYSEDKSKIIDALYNKNFIIENTDNFLNSFKSDYIKKNVLNNFSIAEKRNETRILFTNPSSGDVFVDDLGNKFRLVKIYDGKFQFCYDGSFYMSKNGEASMSGGFAFDVFLDGKEIGSITSEKLFKTNKREKRRFWFFMDNISGASRGIYFNSNVNVFKSISNV